MSIVVRRAELPDSSAIAELAARTFALACPPTASPADISTFIRTRLTAENFAASIADPQRQITVAVVDGAIIGYTMLIFELPADDVARQLTASPTAELNRIYVDPMHHGGAVAGALLENALRHVREMGRSALWLGTNQANRRAQRFYEKNGFVKVGTKRFQLAEQ